MTDLPMTPADYRREIQDRNEANIAYDSCEKVAVDFGMRAIHVSPVWDRVLRNIYIVRPDWEWAEVRDAVTVHLLDEAWTKTVTS